MEAMTHIGGNPICTFCAAKTLKNKFPDTQRFNLTPWLANQDFDFCEISRKFLRIAQTRIIRQHKTFK